MSFFVTKCEVVPFVVETTCICYGSYGGYIYLSKSPDLPTTVGRLANHRWQACQPTLVGTPLPAHDFLPLHDSSLIHDSLPLHHTLPSQDTNTFEERNRTNNTNIHAGLAACLTNLYVGCAAC